MSYKRAWSLCETLNAMFVEPLVESSRGGAQHGGARLTPTGERVLAAFRDLELRSAAATSKQRAAMEVLLMPRAHDISSEK
jgi:molybdate transport system regulatory protein